MHRFITAALLGATIATPLMAQGYPGERGPDGHGAPAQAGQPEDRHGPPPQRRDDRPAPGGERRDGAPSRDRQGQAREGQHRGQPGEADRRDHGLPGRGPQFDRGPGPDRRDFQRGPGLDGDAHHDGRSFAGDPRRDGRAGWDRRPGGNGGPGYDDRGGWDQRWRANGRYDWRGYRAGHRDRFEGRGYYAPHGYGYRRFERGYRIAPAFYDQRYWLLDPYAYRLPPADGPYRWVRYFNDVLLIDVRSGLVVDEVPGFFY